MRRPGHMQEMGNGDGVADRRRNSGLEIELRTGDGVTDWRWNCGPETEQRIGDETADPRWSSGRKWEPRMKTEAKWLAIQESWGMDRGMRADSAAPVFFYGKIAGI